MWFPSPTYSSGKVKLVIYFAQSAAYVVVGQVNTSIGTAFVLSLMRMQPPTSAASEDGFCVVHGLTATGKVGLETALQLSIALGMVLVYQCVTRLRGRCSRDTFRGGLPSYLRRHSCRGGQACCQLLRGTSVPGAALVSGAYGSADAAPLTSAQLLPTDPSAAGQGLAVFEGTVPTLRARLVTATVNFILAAYGSTTVAVMRMLDCVHVPGTPTAQRRLFIRGSVVSACVCPFPV